MHTWKWPSIHINSYKLLWGTVTLNSISMERCVATLQYLWFMVFTESVLLTVQVFVHFLPVGHTHEDIDQMFSRIAVRLSKTNALFLDGKFWTYGIVLLYLCCTRFPHAWNTACNGACVGEASFFPFKSLRFCLPCLSKCQKFSYSMLMHQVQILWLWRNWKFNEDADV